MGVVSENESPDTPAKVPLTARLLLGVADCAQGRRDHRGVYGLITVVGGILERVLDHQEYPTIGRGPVVRAADRDDRGVR